MFRPVLAEHPDELDARIALADALLHLRRFDEGLQVLEPPPPDTAQKSEKLGPWWESVRVRMMRVKFELAHGRTGAFLDAALPLVEETIEGEYQVG